MGDEEFAESAVEQDEDIYSEEGVEQLEDDDEISPEEEAFMKGYNEAISKEGKKKKAEED